MFIKILLKIKPKAQILRFILCIWNVHLWKKKFAGFTDCVRLRDLVLFHLCIINLQQL